MANSYYDVECKDEELKIYAVTKRKENRTYYLTLKDDGTWIHTCKAITVYGDNYMCRHKRMVIGEFFSNKDYKHLFNISPKRQKKEKAVSTETKDRT
jgi:hypothetical protein